MRWIVEASVRVLASPSTSVQRSGKLYTNILQSTHMRHSFANRIEKQRNGRIYNIFPLCIVWAGAAAASDGGGGEQMLPARLGRVVCESLCTPIHLFLFWSLENGLFHHLLSFKNPNVHVAEGLLHCFFRSFVKQPKPWCSRFLLFCMVSLLDI